VPAVPHRAGAHAAKGNRRPSMTLGRR